MAEAAARVKKDGAYIEGKAGLVAHPASKRLDALRRDYGKVLTTALASGCGPASGSLCL